MKMCLLSNAVSLSHRSSSKAGSTCAVLRLCVYAQLGSVSIACQNCSNTTEKKHLMRLRPVELAAFAERRPESFRLLFLQLRGKMATEQEAF